MARNNDVSVKAAKNRERVRKHREKKKPKNLHEKAVAIEFNRRQHADELMSIDNNDDRETESNEFVFENELRTWAANYYIPHRAVNALLGILHPAGFNALPKDSRTLMKTPTHVSIEVLTRGQIWYRGIGHCMQNVFKDFEFAPNTSMTFDINCDGQNLFNSATRSFWPIIIAVRGI